MNSIIEKLMGVSDLTDKIIATDLLISAKTGVRNYAMALTETATPAVREVLHAQLIEAIDMHSTVSNFMMSRGWYHPYNPQEQAQLDMTNADTALNLAEQTGQF